MLYRPSILICTGECAFLSHRLNSVITNVVLFRVDALETVPTKPDEDEEGAVVPDPPRLQLSAEKVLI